MSGDGEEGHVMDIRVIVRVIGDDMMNIVIVFPPADADTAKKITKDNTEEIVPSPIQGESAVTHVMGNKGGLLPCHSHAASRDNLGEDASGSEEEEGKGGEKEDGDTDEIGLIALVGHVQVTQSFDFSIKGLVGGRETLVFFDSLFP